MVAKDLQAALNKNVTSREDCISLLEHEKN